MAGRPSTGQEEVLVGQNARALLGADVMTGRPTRDSERDEQGMIEQIRNTSINKSLTSNRGNDKEQTGEEETKTIVNKKSDKREMEKHYGHDPNPAPEC